MRKVSEIQTFSIPGARNVRVQSATPASNDTPWTLLASLIRNGDLKKAFIGTFQENFKPTYPHLPQANRIFQQNYAIDVQGDKTSTLRSRIIEVVRLMAKDIAIERSKLSSFAPVCASSLVHPDTQFFRVDNVVIIFRRSKSGENLDAGYMFRGV